MNRLIDSISESHNKDYVVALKSIKDTMKLTPQEIQAIEFCLEFWDKYSVFPSRSFLMEKYQVQFDEMTTLSPPELMSHFQTKSTSRGQMELSQLLSGSAQELMEGKDASEILKDITSLFDETIVGNDPVRVTSFHDVRLSEKYEAKNPTIQFGIDEIDSVVKGIESGTVGIIAGYVGSFKTTTAISMSVFNASRGHSSAILTLEMPARALKAQAISAFSASPLYNGSPIAYQPILKGQLTQDDREALADVEESFDALEGDITIFNGSDINGKFIDTLPAAMEWLADRGHKCIFVDHVQLMKYYQPNRDEVKGVDQIIKSMADKSVELDNRGYDFRTVFLSQINREAFKKALRRQGAYDLTCLAEYNEQERSASYVVSLFSTDELKAVNELRVQLLKHRLGETLEEPTAVPVDPMHAMVGGISVMSDFEASESEINDLLGDEFGF